MDTMNIVIIGAGRAGRSFATALETTHRVTLMHHDDVPPAFDADTDVVVLCVPDDAIAATSRRLVVDPDTVVAHVAGSRGLDVLAGHRRVGSLHPLAALSSPDVGARRLRGGVFCVEGDDRLLELVASLGGRTLRVAPEARTLYHATAVSAANHLVALLAHVEALANAAGLVLEDFLALSRQALEDVAASGPAAALTGPASRGDHATLAAHVGAIPLAERDTYLALAQRALRVAQERGPSCSD
jgi:predicted short-subunit dehydrogenase-like oxidoreductase (DUF2520 family)